MDRRAGACGASFLPSWPSFQGLSSAFRTDSLVLPICDPLTGIIDAETRLASAKPRVVIKHRGAKSPKSTRKQAAQRQARAAATQQKGRADCCRRDAVNSVDWSPLTASDPNWCPSALSVRKFPFPELTTEGLQEDPLS